MKYGTGKIKLNNNTESVAKHTCFGNALRPKSETFKLPSESRRRFSGYELNNIESSGTNCMNQQKEKPRYF